MSEACSLLLAADSSMPSLVRWLGQEPPEGDELRLGPGVLPGVVDLSVLGDHGVPLWLHARYAPREGPTVREAEEALGLAREILRMPHGPYQVAFPRPSSPSASCLVAGATWDPPGDDRRLIEIVVRRDPG